MYWWNVEGPFSKLHTFCYCSQQMWWESHIVVHPCIYERSCITLQLAPNGYVRTLYHWVMQYTFIPLLSPTVRHRWSITAWKLTLCTPFSVGCVSTLGCGLDLKHSEDNVLQAKFLRGTLCQIISITSPQPPPSLPQTFFSTLVEPQFTTVYTRGGYTNCDRYPIISTIWVTCNICTNQSLIR